MVILVENKIWGGGGGGAKLLKSKKLPYLEGARNKRAKYILIQICSSNSIQSIL